MRLSHPALADPEFYVPGLPAGYVADRYGIGPADIAKLGSAENPLGASPLAVQAVGDRLDDLHLYPSWTAEPLREKVSQTYSFEPERVMCGAGETEIISWLIRAFCAPGGRIQTPASCSSPTRTAPRAHGWPRTTCAASSRPRPRPWWCSTRPTCTTRVPVDTSTSSTVMAAQYSARFNIAAAVLADPADPAAYHPDRIADPALAVLQAKVSRTLPDPTFDATYAWKQGARVQLNLTDGRVLERTVHGQRGSMHDPLSDEEIERKFHTLADGRLDPEVPEVVRSLPDLPVAELTRLLRSGWRSDASQAR